LMLPLYKLLLAPTAVAYEFSADATTLLLTAAIVVVALSLIATGPLPRDAGQLAALVQPPAVARPTDVAKCRCDLAVTLLSDATTKSHDVSPSTRRAPLPSDDPTESACA
jgi:hypothetical protein